MLSFIAFLHANWPLASLFVLIFLYILFEEFREHSDAHASPQFCVSLMNHENAMVWDLRAESAYQAGHIVGAEHVSAGDAVERFESQKNPDRKRPLILVCQRGTEAVKALKKIEKKNKEQDVLAMQGGMQQWQRDELPMTSKGEKHG